MPERLRQAISILLMGAAIVAAPLAWRPVVATWGPAESRIVPSYLPALEPSRDREPFDPSPIEELKAMTPGFVVIGDSMAGRVDPNRLTALTGEQTVSIVQNATGSGYWYLAVKNYVVASGVRPKRVFVFFRDTNLTDVLFRLDGAYRFHLDEVAGEREDALNRVVAARLSESWYGVHQGLDRAYGVERTRAWIDRALTRWPAAVVAGGDRQEQVLTRANAAFALEKLRTMDAADLAAAEERSLNFGANVDVSALPLLLSLAREHGMRLCFVRVMRRPVNGAAPAESAGIRRYVEDLRTYLTTHGADFMDDRDDPALTRLEYADGDHITQDARAEYTERLAERVRALAQ